MRAPTRALYALSLVLSTLVLAACDEPRHRDRSDDDCTPKAQATASDGVCEGSASSCSSLSALGCSSEGCSVDIGAYDDPYDDRCTGYAEACSEQGNDVLCSYQVGCSWVAGSAEPSADTGNECPDASNDGGGGSTGAGSLPGTGAGSPSGGAGGSVTTSSSTSGAGGTGAGPDAPPGCPFTNDGECDEPEGTGLCPEGSDSADCGR